MSRREAANKGVRYGVVINTSKKNDLVNYLVELHKSLCQLSQSVADRPKGFRVTTDQLISSKILNHSDKDVRLIACCCVVDVLRIFAPEAPFSDEDTIKAFDVLTAQIRGMATTDMQSAVGLKINYLLSSLGTVKSCVVPVLLAQQGVSGADETVTAFLDALLSSVRPEHSEEVIENALTVLHTCVDEMEDINQDILDLLLYPLTPAAKAENSAAYTLACSLLRKVSANVEKPLSSFINNALVNGVETETDSKSAEIAADLYAVIYEVHKVSPSVLTQVIPNICSQLQTEEEDIRSKAVQLLARLFSSPFAEYARDFARNFRDYMNRLNDLSPNIRLEMVANCGELLEHKPDLRATVEDALVSKLKDPDSAVRLASLNSLLDMLYKDPMSLSAEALSDVCDRVKDKKVEVRMAALLGLSKTFHRYISSVLPPLSSLSVPSAKSVSGWLTSSSSGIQEVASRLSIIPSLVVKSWSYPEFTQKHLVIQVLQEYILPKSVSENSSSSSSSGSGKRANAGSSSSSSSSSSGSVNHDQLNERRASALVLLIQCLQPMDVTMLGNILFFKSRVHNEISSLVDARASSASNLEVMRQCAFRLVQLVPTADRKITIFEKLYANKDKTVFRLLGHCVGARDSVAQAMEHRGDLKQRLESKSALGEYFPAAYDFGANMLVNESMIGSMLKYVVVHTRSALSSSSKHQHSTLQSVQEVCTLLFTVSRNANQVFGSCAAQLVQWLECVSSDIDAIDASSASSASAKIKEARQGLVYMCISTIENAASTICKTDATGSTNLCAAVISFAKRIDDHEMCARLAETASQIAYFANVGSASLQNDQNAVDLTTFWIKHLSSSKCLSLDNDRLLCDLTAFANLTKVPLVTYARSKTISKRSLSAMNDTIHSVRDRMFEFIATELLGEREAEVGDMSTVLELCAGLKVLTAMLATEEEMKQLGINSDTKAAEGEGDFSVSTSSSMASAEFDQLVSVLFDCISSGAEGVAQARINIEHPQQLELRTVLFECVTQCAISLTKIKHFGNTISVDNWHRLGWALLDQAPAAARKQLQLLGSIVRTHPIHAKFLAYPCLFASKEPQLSEIAQNMMLFAVRRLRSTHQELCTKAITSDGAEAENLKRLADSSMPESILPYLLHLLSYHPEFPTSSSVESEEDKIKLNAIVTCVKMLLRSLHDSLSNSANNVSFLLKQLNLINQRYIDRHDNDNIGLQFVTRVAAKITTELVKTADNAQVYSGEIFLPAELYERKAVSRKSLMTEEQLMEQEQLAVLSAMGMEEAETAIERALNSKKGAGGGGAGGGGARGHHRAAAAATAAPTAGFSPSPTKAVSGKTAVRAKVSPAALIEERRAAAAAAAAASMPVEEPSRRLPSRAAKSAVAGGGAYREVEESRSEVAMWEKQAVNSSSSSSSGVSSDRRRSSAGSVVSTNSGIGMASTAPFTSLSNRPPSSMMSPSKSSSFNESAFNSKKKRLSSSSSASSASKHTSQRDTFDIFSSQPLDEDLVGTHDAKRRRSSETSATTAITTGRKPLRQQQTNVVAAAPVSSSSGKSAAGSKKRPVAVVLESTEAAPATTSRTTTSAGREKVVAESKAPSVAVANGRSTRSSRPIRA